MLCEILMLTLGSSAKLEQNQFLLFKLVILCRNTTSAVYVVKFLYMRPFKDFRNIKQIMNNHNNHFVKMDNLTILCR